MIQRFRSRLTYPHVVSTLALFVALGGTGYAAATIGSSDIKNDAVRTRHLADGVVKARDLGANSVGSAAVIDGSLRRKDFGAQLVPEGPAGGDLAGTFPAPRIRPAEDWRGVATVFGTCTDTRSDAAWCTNQVGNTDGFNEWLDRSFASPEPFGLAGFYRDRTGIVRLRGLARCRNHFNLNQPCSNIGSEPVLRLPPGYRPSYRLVLTTQGDYAARRVDVAADGLVIYENGAGAFDFLSLNGIAFRCAPSGANGCP